MSEVVLKFFAVPRMDTKTEAPVCGLQRTDKVTESKCLCESATVAAVEIGTVPEIKSRETCSAG